MKLFPIVVVLTALVCSARTSAHVDCTDPVEQWKPRDSLRQEVEKNGWTIQRIKVDDGCYEVRAVDRNGNKVKAKYSPATLKLRSFEVEFEKEADTAEYLPGFGRKHDVGVKRDR
jgi:hypothetical protein